MVSKFIEQFLQYLSVYIINFNRLHTKFSKINNKWNKYLWNCCKYTRQHICYFENRLKLSELLQYLQTHGNKSFELIIEYKILTSYYAIRLRQFTKNTLDLYFLNFDVNLLAYLKLVNLTKNWLIAPSHIAKIKCNDLCCYSRKTVSHRWSEKVTIEGLFDKNRAL